MVTQQTPLPGQTVIRRPIFYLDINTQFRRNSKGLDIQNLDAINNQIRNLLTTVRGTRPFRPKFGSELPELLFEPMDEITAWRIETAVFDAIEAWMSDRIILDHNESRVTPDVRIQTYSVELKYYVIFNEAIGFYRVRLKRNQRDEDKLNQLTL